MPTKILVIDEKPDESDGTVGWLRQQAYEVTIVDQAEQASAIAEQVQPDLVLLSAALRSTSSTEVSQRLRQNSNSAHIPIILLTERSGTEARAESIRTGANDFVSLPLKPADLKYKINAILNAGTLALGDNFRLLDETCNAALLMLPCNLAWLLIIEDGTLRSRMIASDRGRGSSAGEVFLRLMAGGESGHPSFLLVPGDNPLSDIVLDGNSLINVTLDDLQNVTDGGPLLRAVKQLQLSYVHFLPLEGGGQTIGMLVLGSKQAHDNTSTHGQKLILAIMNQAATVVENSRLVMGLAARQEQMRAEQAFRKMVLDTMGDALVVIDDEAIIRYANNRLLRMSGYTREELYGNSVGAIFHSSARDTLISALRREGSPTVNFSQQLVTKTGRIIPVLMSRSTGAVGGTADRSTVLVLSDLSEQKRREQALERQSERLRALNRAAQAITSALSVDDVIALLLQSTAEIVQSRSTCLFMRNDSNADRYSVVAAIGVQAEALDQMLSVNGTGLIGQVIQDRKGRLVAQVAQETDPAQQVEPAGSALLVVPLMVIDQVIGVLEAVDKVEGKFVQEDLEILENLVSSASVAIENARLFGQTQRRVNELSTLLESSAAVSSTLEIGSVLELIARRLLEALSVVHCSIATWNRGSGALVVLAKVSNAYWDIDCGPQRSPAMSKWLSIILEQELPCFFRLADERLDSPMQAYMRNLGVDNALLFPLRWGEEVVGLLELFNTRPEAPFDTRSLEAVDECIKRWRDQLRKQGQGEWFERDSLTDLYQRVVRPSGATWCIISRWDSSTRTIRSMRESGFAFWDDETGLYYELRRYPLMELTLTDGSTITLDAETLRHDPNERQMIADIGAGTGLIIPLLVRGEAIGLVKLLDSTSDRVFDIAEITLSQGIGNVVANAMENAQLYKSLERRADALQAAYDELRLSDKVKDALIQNLSHELQTPLHQVVMQLDLLMDGAFGPVTTDQHETMQSSMAKITGLGDMIRDMVSLRALDTDGLAFEYRSLNQIIETVVRSVMPKANQFGLQIVTDLPAETSQVWADSGRIAEVLDQLVDNAIKFSPRNERSADRLEIRVEDSSSLMVQVCVEDYGIGIPSEEFDKIFHRGYQVDGSMTRRFGGTGLGLALARQIVEAHGGKIWVESSGSGGSQFLFTIPKTEIKSQD